MSDGWYKITQGNNVLIRYFKDSCTGAGYHIDEYTRFGGTIEPVVVLTPAEYDELRQRIVELEAKAVPAKSREEIEADARAFVAEVKLGRIRWTK